MVVRWARRGLAAKGWPRNTGTHAQAGDVHRGPGVYTHTFRFTSEWPVHTPCVCATRQTSSKNSVSSRGCIRFKGESTMYILLSIHLKGELMLPCVLLGWWAKYFVLMSRRMHYLLIVGRKCKGQIYSEEWIPGNALLHDTATTSLHIQYICTHFLVPGPMHT